MTTQEIRPFPVHRTVLMRSVLLAFSKIGAELDLYNEQEGIIIATVKRIKIGKIGLGEQEIKASVRENEQTSLLELTAPDGDREELLRLISTYVTQGAKAVKDDAISQWSDLIRDEEARRKQRQKISDAVGKIPFLPRSKERDTSLVATDSEFHEVTAPGTSLTVVNTESKALAPIKTRAIELEVPHGPGMLLKNRRKQVFEIQVDPIVFSDRTHFLQICKNCHATVLEGSLFCSVCGRALTLEAVTKDELNNKTLNSANASLRYGLMGLVPNVGFLLFTLAPFVLAVQTLSIPSAIIEGFRSTFDMLSQGLIKSVIPILIFVALPSFLLGRKAVSEGQKALLYLNMNFNVDKVGQKRAALGHALGWFDLYLGLSFLVLVLISGYIKS